MIQNEMYQSMNTYRAEDAAVILKIDLAHLVCAVCGRMFDRDEKVIYSVSPSRPLMVHAPQCTFLVSHRDSSVMAPDEIPL